MLIRTFYFSSLIIFLFGAFIFWVYSDQFFQMLLGVAAPGSPFGGSADRTAFNQTITIRETFMWGVVAASVVCLVLSVIFVSSAIKMRLIAYFSLLVSAITLVVFFILFFGHGVIPIHGIL